MAFRFAPRSRSAQTSHTSRRVRRAKRAQELRPNLFTLEDRQLLSTIVVDNPTDTPAVGYTDLREAVTAAAADTTDDTITFDPSVFGTQQTITLTSNAINLTKAAGTLTITGPGANLLSVSGNSASAVFGLGGGNAALSGLTITGAANGPGAMINMGGRVTLTNCVVSDNNVVYGAVYTGHQGTTKLIDSSVTNNVGTDAGGVFNFQNATTELDDSSISNNTGSQGGGVLNLGGVVALGGCTISDNTSSQYAGGISNGYLGPADFLCVMVLTDCTLSGNTAGEAVGALLNGPGASATLNNCTISGNSSGYAGGLANAGGYVELGNTIVAGNTSPTAPDAYGSLHSLGNNLIGVVDSKASGLISSDLTGTNDSPINPLLAPLGSYGGPTQTMPPLPGSPAIAVGNTALIPSGDTIDQRGQSRTLNGAVDLGAVQTQGFTLTVTGGDNQTAPINAAFTNPLAVSVTADNGLDPVNGGILTFTPPATGASATLSATTATISGGAASVTATANGSFGGYSVSATTNGVDSPASFGLSNVETPSLVVDTTSDVVDSSDSLTSLREAIAYAEALGGDQTITFDPSVFNAPTTITLNSGQLQLADTTGTLTIDGPGADMLSINGNNAGRVFYLTGGGAAISGLTITAGSTPYGGAALWNGGGTATLSHCIVSGNNSGYGAVTTANGGTTTLTDTTVSNNTGYYGGGVTNLSNGTTTLEGSAITNNSAFVGGGLDNGFANFGVSGAIMVLTDCTISGNTATYGGGLISSYDNTITLSNTTISGNHANYYGGFLNQNGSTATLNNCTVGGNTANAHAGIGTKSATLNIANTIVAGNTNGSGTDDVYGDFTSQGNNLIGGADNSTGWTSSDLTGTDAGPLNALLAPLGNYGGVTQTMPLLPGSPAIAAGNVSLIPTGLTTDQRGLPRVVNGTVDIGAAESQGYTMTATGGDGQSVISGFIFTNPLSVSVSANNPDDPVDGGVITFTGPASGASAIILPATISGGTASGIATANGTAGTYNVAATANGVSSTASFSLTNVAGSLVVDTTNDAVDISDGVTSLREAILYAIAIGGDQTITFDSSVFSTPQTITLTSGVIDLTDPNGALTIDGPGASILSVSGNNASNVFQVSVGLGSTNPVTISGLTITGGQTGSGGAALWNDGGSVALTGCVVSGNNSGYGAVTTAYGGTTTLTDCTVSSNTGYYGGGVTNLNSGTTTLDDCTISNNSAFTGGGLDNGFANFGVSGAIMVLTDCTISGNTATYGGGLISSYSNSITLTNTTISGNHASYYGGFLNQNGSTATLDNCTVSANTANSHGGIGTKSATLNIANTIVAGNTNGSGTDDVYGDFTSQGNNMIGGADNSTGWTSSDWKGTDSNPFTVLLAPLGNYGGVTQTMPPLPGSLAIAAGNVSLIPTGVTTDQRGLPRVVNGTVDIGAAQSQGYTLTPDASGNPQSAIIGLPFAKPLTVTAVPNNPNDPVNGGSIVYTSPTSGASTTVHFFIVEIQNGKASLNAAANTRTGTYNVTVTGHGVTSPALFSLTNLPGSLVVNTTSDATSPTAGVTTLREAVAYAETLHGNQTITFDTSVFSTAQTITLTSGAIDLADRFGALTITGPGANLLSISGNNASGVFVAQGFGVNNSSIALSGLTITGGKNPTGGALNFSICSVAVTDCTITGNTGSGLYGSTINLTLVDSTFSNNRASGGAGLYISSGATATITGCTFSNNLARNGGGIDIENNATVTMTGCTFSGNSAANGGGISNTAGSKLTITDCTLTHNTALVNGGGIVTANNAPITITDCLLSNNTANYYGGGISALYGTSFTITNSTVSNNSAKEGGGIYGWSSATITVVGCGISNNSATSYGGGLYSASGCTVTMTGSTISDNTAATGGGLLNSSTSESSFPSLMTLTDCTISGNNATIQGGGLINGFNGVPSTATLNDCTVSGNSAPTAGGVYNVYGTINLANTIIAANSASTAAPDALGAFTSLGNNLIGGADDSTGWVSTDMTGTDAGPLNTLLAPLGNYGGLTQTMPPLPGSPAIAAGDASLIPSGVTTDQRGQSRTFNSTVDIGAVQTQGFTATITGGNNQKARPGSAFANPLMVSVSADNGLDPVNGGILTFSPPASGASATLSAGTATISGGTASVTATANGTQGDYTVIAAAIGLDSPASFSLTNTLTPTTTTLTSSIASLVFGQSVTFSATVSSVVAGGTPTGTVTFMDGSTVLGSATLNGVAGNDQATFSPSSLSPGAHNITAVYGADSYFKSSASANLGLSVSSTPQLQGGVLAIAGTVSNGTITLTPTLPSGASAYRINVSYTSGGTTTNFGPYAVSSIAVYDAAGNDAVILNDTSAKDTFTVGNGTVTESAAQTTLFTVTLNGVGSTKINGNGGGDTLTGPNQTNSWLVNSANSGSLNGSIAFQNIPNLFGGSGDDSFKFANAATIAGTINGGGGTNSLDLSAYTTPVSINLPVSRVTGLGGSFTSLQSFIGGSNIANKVVAPNTASAFNVTGANAGTVNGLSFSGFGNLVGGSGNDTFTFAAGATLTGNLDGGGGTNTIDLSAYTTPVSMNLPVSRVTGLGGSFTSLQSFIGGVNFANKVIAPNTASAFNITGANTGSVNGLSFSGFGNLVGGTGNDTFTFSAGATLAGNLDGGGGTNTIDLSAYTTAVSMNLPVSRVTGLGGSFTSLQSFIGGGNIANKVIAPNSASVFNITGANTGTINSLSFSGFGNLVGGTGDDTFVFSQGATLTGGIDGGGGTNTLDLSAYTTQVSVNFPVSRVTGLGGTFSSLQSFLGGSYYANKVIAPNTASAFNITGANAGTINGLSFSGFGNLTGGSGNDTFQFSAGATLTGGIDGGGGSNTLDLSAYTSAVSVNLPVSRVTGLGGTFAAIQSFIGGSSSSNKIVGPNTASAFQITGANTETLGGSTFTGFGNIAGGSGDDTFIFSSGATLSGSLDGGAGTNAIDLSSYTTPTSINMPASRVTGLGGSYASIQSFIGGSNAANKVQGPNTSSVFQITGANAGNVAGVSFTGFGNLIGGTGDDVFAFSDGATLTGSINGGTGTNWLNYSLYTANLTVNLATGKATGVGTTISNILDVRGGSGNDTFTGNSAGNILIGGAGNDTINGGTGVSLLIGGTGTDTINGGSGGDLIIGGSTSYDNNNAVLDSILAEWRSSDSFATRVNLIKNGGGLNGTNVLNLGTTVIDDVAVNVLTGASGGKNWYFKGSKDNITNLQSGDQVN